MKKIYSYFFAGAIAAIGLASPLNADPNGLSQIDSVHSNLDSQASAFQLFNTSTLNPFISANTIGGVYSPSNTLGGNIQLSVDSNVRVYFLGTDAAFNNTLAFDRNANSQVNPGIDGIIFQNQHALNLGDYVNLGLVNAGDFKLTLLSDGAFKTTVGADHIFSTDPSSNPDGTVHARITLFHGPNSDFYLIGWEDLNKFTDPTYDADYNDFFVVVEASVAVPEPETYALLGTLLAGIAIYKSRRVKV